MDVVEFDLDVATVAPPIDFTRFSRKRFFKHGIELPEQPTGHDWVNQEVVKMVEFLPDSDADAQDVAWVSPNARNNYLVLRREGYEHITSVFPSEDRSPLVARATRWTSRGRRDLEKEMRQLEAERRELAFARTGGHDTKCDEPMQPNSPQPKQQLVEPADFSMCSARVEQDEIAEFVPFTLQSSHLGLDVSYSHTQLRQLLCCTTPFDFYYTGAENVYHYSLLTHQQTAVTSIGVDWPRSASRMCSMAVDPQNSLLFAGGIRGEFMAKNIKSGAVLVTCQLTAARNAICNGITLYNTPAGNRRVLCSNNDCFVKSFDVPSLKQVFCYNTEWPVNSCCPSNDGRMLCLVADSKEVVILDAHTGNVAYTLHGHLDYSFSAAWHPSDHVLATGNQDRTVQVWDLRHTARSVHVLESCMATVRAMQYSHDGSMLLAGEGADFVHIFDADSQYKRAQTITYWGSLSGVTFTEDEDALVIAVQAPVRSTENDGLMVYASTEDRLEL